VAVRSIAIAPIAFHMPKAVHMSTPTTNRPLVIGSLIFPKLDQLDFTGPFEVFSRIPNASVYVLWKDTAPLADMMGLVLTPQTRLDECPPLDVLHIPGGYGQQALMDDEAVLSFVREQASNAKCILSVCTGALICGAAGLLKDRRATTHWASFDLLEYFGAIPIKARTVSDGNLITTAGVTAGIDAALQMAARFRGEELAQQIQLTIEYAPEPPFNSGTPETAPRNVHDAVKTAYEEIQSQRRATAERVAERLGVVINSSKARLVETP